VSPGVPARAFDFRLLGPLEVESDGAVLPVGGPRQRALLAFLLLHANEAVRRELERAARLLGAAASLRQASGAAEQPEGSILTYLNEVTATSREELGDEAFAAAFASGRAHPNAVVSEELGRVRAE
jgi:hypothetical protein